MGGRDDFIRLVRVEVDSMDASLVPDKADV